jgi:nucleotide-binding universal stress UspA family protein
MVPLGLGDEGEASIRYAAMISRMAESQKIYFAHIARSLDIPEELYEKFPDLVEPVDEIAKTKIEKLITQYFEGYQGSTIGYEIKEGYPLNEILHLSKQKNIDLIIIGKKGGPMSGTLAEKVARKAPCSTLIIPVGSVPKLTNILVSVDFSENSIDAMDVAIAFASAHGEASVHCLHVYNVPIGYYKTGKTYEKFGEIMKGYAEKHYQEFINRIDCKGISVKPIFKLDKKVPKAIEETLAHYQTDLLLMGARGRQAGAGVLLGSVTEKLIRTTAIPLIAVKKKGAGMSILDALLKL